MKKCSICLIVFLSLLVFSGMISAQEIGDTKGIKIGIIDTGFNPNHPDLENIEVKAGEPTAIDRVKEFFSYPIGILPLSHGNAVASIIGETAGKEKGADLYGYHANAFEDFRDALRASADDGTQIINVSMGWTGGFGLREFSTKEKKYMQQQLDDFFKTKLKDVLVVVPAGNEPISVEDEPLAGLATKHDNIITVAAINQKGEKFASSAYGDAVTIAAPGEDIWVAQSGIGFTPDYDYQSGTSYAAPFITGVAAQILAANPSLTPKEIKEIIMDTAEPHQFDNDKPLGAGVINAEKAVAEAIERGKKYYLCNLEIGDRVIDPSWEWDFKLGENYSEEVWEADPATIEAVSEALASGKNLEDIEIEGKYIPTPPGEIKPVTWIVVAKDHYGEGSGATLLSEELIGLYTFDNSFDRQGRHGSGHWGKSGTTDADHGIRPWLNSSDNYLREGFYNAFSESFKNSIIEIDLPNRDWEYGNYYETKDKVFIPSTTEIGDSAHSYTYEIGEVYPYFSGATDQDRTAYLGNNEEVYWTRSPASYQDQYEVSLVSLIYPDGSIGSQLAKLNLIGVRPAVNLDCQTQVSEFPNDEGIFEIY